MGYQAALADVAAESDRDTADSRCWLCSSSSTASTSQGSYEPPKKWTRVECDCGTHDLPPTASCAASTTTTSTRAIGSSQPPGDQHAGGEPHLEGRRSRRRFSLTDVNQSGQVTGPPPSTGRGGLRPTTCRLSGRTVELLYDTKGRGATGIARARRGGPAFWGVSPPLCSPWAGGGTSCMRATEDRAVRTLRVERLARAHQGVRHQELGVRGTGTASAANAHADANAGTTPAGGWRRR